MAYLYQKQNNKKGAICSLKKTNPWVLSCTKKAVAGIAEAGDNIGILV